MSDRDPDFYYMGVEIWTDSPITPEEARILRVSIATGWVCLVLGVGIVLGVTAAHVFGL